MSTARLITALTPLAGSPPRVLLVVDGLTIGVISAALMPRLDLQVGHPFTPAMEPDVLADAALLGTVDRAASLLGHSAMSRATLREKLLRRGEPEALVDAALARLVALHLLDDHAYAAQMIRSAIGRGQRSRHQLAADLERRGVARPVIAAALAAAAEDGDLPDEQAGLRAAATKKLRTLARYPAPVQARRLAAHLARRGFEEEAIRALVADLTGVALDQAPLDDAEADWADGGGDD